MEGSWGSVRSSLPCDITLRGKQGKLRMSPKAARTARSAKNASSRLEQIR